jgi:hypothetical protein
MYVLRRYTRGSVDRISYDVVFLRAIVGAVYPSAWPLPVVAIGLSIGGAQDPKVVRGRLAAYVSGFVVAYLLLHLYGTPVADWLQRHEAVGALSLAFVLMFEGLFLLGVQNVWARLRGRSPGQDPASDATTSAILGILMPFEVSLGLIGPALQNAAKLGDAGSVGPAAAAVAAVAVGAAVTLVVLGLAAQALASRAPAASKGITRGVGGAFAVIAVLIALGMA